MTMVLPGIPEEVGPWLHLHRTLLLETNRSIHRCKEDIWKQLNLASNKNIIDRRVIYDVSSSFKAAILFFKTPEAAHLEFIKLEKRINETDFVPLKADQVYVRMKCFEKTALSQGYQLHEYLRIEYSGFKLKPSFDDRMRFGDSARMLVKKTYVDYKSPAEAILAIWGLDRAKFNGQVVKIDKVTYGDTSRLKDNEELNKFMAIYGLISFSLNKSTSTTTKSNALWKRQDLNSLIWYTDSKNSFNVVGGLTFKSTAEYVEEEMTFFMGKIMKDRFKK